MAQIFISYAREDENYANRLTHHLEELGHSTWKFDEGISPGQKWQDVIFDKLKSVDALVLILSEATSRSSWVNHEFGAALAYSRERGKPIIIPVVLDLATAPSTISQIQSIYSNRQDAEDVAIKIATAIEYQLARTVAQEEKRQKIQENVENSAATYIKKSLLELREREVSYRRLAYFWYSIAYLTLLISVGFGVWRALIVGPQNINWESLLGLAISSVVVIILLIALAKYAFTLGKSFMVESLRNADRRHAISFGEFYLQAFGASADWKEVKEAFQHWNIDKGSHFIGQNTSEFDPQIINIAAELAKIIADKYKKHPS